MDEPSVPIILLCIKIYQFLVYYRPAAKSGLLGTTLPISKLANKENETEEKTEEVDTPIEQTNPTVVNSQLDKIPIIINYDTNDITLELYMTCLVASVCNLIILYVHTQLTLLLSLILVTKLV